MTNVTGNFSDDMRKYVVTVPPLLTTVEGVEITLPAVVFEFDTDRSTTPADVASALQEYVDKYSSIQADHATYLCQWLRSNTCLGKGITSAFERALENDNGHSSLGSHVVSVTDLNLSYKLVNELRLEWARHCITTLLSTPSPRNKEMNDKHNHRLLRPAKLKDLQIGDVLILKDSSPVSKSSVTYKTNKFVVLRYRDGSEGTYYQSRLEIDYALAPLCWVEGKPVYPGDGPLYYKDNPSWKHNEEGVFASSIRDDELHFRGGIAFPISDATWTKPQVEPVPSFQVEGQDVFPGDTVYYCGDEKHSWGREMVVEKGGFVNGVHADSFSKGAASFRLKPQLVIGDRLVPMPEREAPAVGIFFTASPHVEDYYSTYSWSGDKSDLRWLERGLVHLTKEAAIAHGEALVALSKKKDLTVTTPQDLSVTYMTGDRRSVFLYRHKVTGKFLYIADFTTHTGRHINLYLVDALKATQFAMNNLLAVNNRVRDQLLREFDEQAFEWVEAEVFTSIFVKRK